MSAAPRLAPVTLPGGLPLAGHLPAFRRDRLALIAACGRAGDVVSLRLGPWRAHVLSHPELVRALLVDRQDAFAKSPALRAARFVLGDGLLTSEGETHRRHRRLVQPTLGRARLGRLGQDVAQHSARVTAAWSDGAVVDAHAAARTLTLGVAAETILRARLDGEAATLARAVDVLLDAYDSALLPVASLAPWLPLPRVRRWRAARRAIDAVVRARVPAAGAPAPGAARDVLSALLRARDERGGLSAREVRDELVTLLLAGHETGASALAWTLHLLASHPEARARVEAEAAAADPSQAEDALPWARAAVAEALRLYPPSWAMGRRALRDVDLAGQRVRRGELAIVSQWVLHRDPRWWPHPEVFDPGRWLRPDDAPPAYAYFPFGAGRRRCVGEPMALAEAALAVAAIVRGWRLEPAGDAPVPRALLTLRPAAPVRLRVRRHARAAQA